MKDKIKTKQQHVHTIDDLEFDRYDTRETEYFVSRNQSGRVVGVIRSNPTTSPYMLEECFSFLSEDSLPKDPLILEASRLVVDSETLKSQDDRAPGVNELLVALMERGLQLQLSEYVGFMTPGIWKRTFRRIGWEPDWLGAEMSLPEYDRPVRAGRIRVNREIHEQLKISTGLTGDTILNFGRSGTASSID